MYLFLPNFQGDCRQRESTHATRGKMHATEDNTTWREIPPSAGVNATSRENTIACTRGSTTSTRDNTTTGYGGNA